MRTSARRPSRLLPVLIAVGLLTACAGADAAAPDGSPAPSAAPSTPGPRVYVAVGASETVGIGADDPQKQAWPQVLHDSAVPASRLVNVGISGATVRQALVEELPGALAADPDLVTVWLAVNDITALVPVGTYEGQLRTLVHALRRDGETEVLVANVPDLWELPAYRACIPGAGDADVPCGLPLVPSEAEVRAIVEQFNAAISRVVRAEGARLVDLSGEGELTGLTSEDGFHPSTAGHRAVAEAFERVLER